MRRVLPAGHGLGGGDGGRLREEVQPPGFGVAVERGALLAIEHDAHAARQRAIVAKPGVHGFPLIGELVQINPLLHYGPAITGGMALAKGMALSFRA